MTLIQDAASLWLLLAGIAAIAAAVVGALLTQV